MRPALVLLIAVALLASGSVAARAERGRRLTPQQVRQVLAIKREVDAQRAAKDERRRKARADKKRTRDLKLLVAYRMAAEYKADKARREEKAKTDKAREEGQRNAARIRFIEQLLREREQRGR